MDMRSGRSGADDSDTYQDMLKRKVCIYDVDYVADEKKTAVRMWGVTDTGETLIAIDKAFRPYFYVEVGSSWKSRQRTNDVMQMIRELGDLVSGAIKKVETVKKNLLGEEREFIRITVQQPADVIRVWDIIKNWPSIKSQYEYSIPFRKRYIIDNNIPMMEWVEITGRRRKCIEMTDICIDVLSVKRVEDYEKIPPLRMMSISMQIMKDKIIMISLAEPGGYRKILTHGTEIMSSDNFSIEVMETENDMIERFSSIISERDPHIIFTYNGDRTDFRMLHERAEKLGIELRVGRDRRGLSFFKKGKSIASLICGRAHIDAFAFVNNIISRTTSFETTDISDVSKKLIGERPELLEWKEIEMFWNNKTDIIRIMKHLMNRTLALMKLSEQLTYKIYQFSNICRQTIFDVSRMRYTQMIDWILVREAYRLGEIILNLPTKTEIKMRYSIEPYEGGYSKETIEGIHKNVAILEFSDLYPAVITQHNISPEMLDTDSEIYKDTNHVPGTEHFFSKNKRGFVPAVIMHAKEEREKITEAIKNVPRESDEYRFMNARKYALRALPNAAYGYFAYPGSRWYSRMCASAIAAWGREYMKRAIARLESMHHKVIYAETYTAFISDTSSWSLRRSEERLKDVLPKDVDINTRGPYKSGIFLQGFGNRAKYALLDEDGKLSMKGFEATRKDWSGIAKETQEIVLMSILKDKSAKRAEGIVRNVIIRLKAGDVDMNELVMRNQITKPLERYDQAWPHVSAARKLAARGGTIAVGSEISYIIASGPGTISERAEPFGYTDNYDPDYYIRNQILASVGRIFEIVGMNIENIEDSINDNIEQEKLKRYFKKSFKERIRERFGI
ncbi:MAG: hypothetical protein GXO64_02295 [Candidatus Micrarchaeota archaeon]|nr:hypothetical protein [Candidatus Micrarchaeota archaeon]